MENSGDRDTGVWSRVKALGSGAFGVVELWRNADNGETRAIKKCQLDVSKMSPRQIERWNEEVEFMNRINHPNIVGTRKIPIGVMNPNSRLPVLCMEYCRKGDLRDVLIRPENFWGLNETEALRSMRDISSAVEYLHHNGITHRDLKPQNIVIQDGRSGTIYKLIDLGYAKEMGEASAAASIVGTLNYVAPELFWKGTYSSSVDYWSLGILFYEILTGTRPFLPNMAVSKNWLGHIKNKKPEHISAREVNGKVEFSSKIEDPSNVSQCLREALTPWFRLVLQWQPSTRGKIVENGRSSVGVFHFLKTIFTKKVLHLFFVSTYKRDSYLIENITRVREVGKIISEREKIGVDEQLLVSSGGKLLDAPEGKILDFLEEGDEVIVFEREKLLVGTPQDAVLPRDVQRMAEGGLKTCDYHTLRRYYGATVLFMKQQVELYKGYLIALSIKIDLINTNFTTLSQKIEKILSDSFLLHQSLQEVFPPPEDNVRPPQRLQNCHQKDLHKRISNFLSSARGMKNEFQNLSEQKDNWTEKFSSSVDSSRLSGVLEEAVDVLMEFLPSEQNKVRKPKRMIEIYFKFLQVRHEMLSCEGLRDIGEHFLGLEREMVKLERALESFQMILGQCQRDLQAASQGVGVARAGGGGGDDLVRDNIVLGHLINGLLTEMEDIKAKLGSLD
ncbi:inhibitor of nuclear factor kappa-B kinase subunit beta [Diachasma alloeum]|uniref:inhibitor of nuclear factor kappa-B kinase subunit beta n=1 Tax=Diachasma alloeum TaxID=454923 RepID=UPI0007383FF4|nr:inhibitor of nuclear factor kappa-B kinase subunit beta [Diachasma alloeum]